MPKKDLLDIWVAFIAYSIADEGITKIGG